jgi:hypothetical protein
MGEPVGSALELAGTGTGVGFGFVGIVLTGFGLFVAWKRMSGRQ